MLKLPPRAEVPQDFQDAMRDLAERSLQKFRTDLSFMRDYEQQMYKQDNAGALVKLDKIRRDPKAMLEAVTKLRSTPYTQFAYMTIRNEPCFYGLTKDIILDDDNGKGHTFYNMGPYHVYIPFDNFLGKNRNFQFIPARDPHSYYRHPHHRDGHTCWGSFNAVVQLLLREGDVVEMFRTIAIYLTRYDLHSVLTHKLSQEAYPFMTLVSK
jgi:hypothetical protein